MYQEGQGVEQSYHQAMLWYKKAANLEFSEGYYNVAVLYDKGLGVQQNREEAIKWYTIAATKVFFFSFELMAVLIFFSLGKSKRTIQLGNNLWTRQRRDPKFYTSIEVV
jgi:TPR repeat protein